jgi:DNA-binding SARP family transcriptional activator
LKAFSQNDLLSGLYFSSHEVIQDKRTSLNLTPRTFFKISDNFSLEFEANFRRGDGYYGYIFRLIGNDEVNIDLVSNFASSASNFGLVYKEQTLFSFKWDQLPGAGYGQWVKIRLDIDIPASLISLSIDDTKQDMRLPESLKTDLFNIGFGAFGYRHFVNVDVCPMSLKNIRIFNNGKLCRYWRLVEHFNNKVYDEIKNAEAIVHNPIWIINRHVKWEKIKDFQVDNLMGSAHDRINRRLFFLNDKEIYCIHLESFEMDTIPYSKNKPYEDGNARQLIYNEYFDQLWSYDFTTDAISVFDFDTFAWSENPIRRVNSQYAHQNRFISPIDSSLISLLGYGYYKYSSDVSHYNRQSGSWEMFDRKDQIGPRYLSGATVINDNKALVFGGFGSLSGLQELSPKFYYDLFSFDLADFTFQKILTFPAPETPFVPCESLVFDEESNSFYTMLYNSMQHNTHLRLGRFDITNGSYSIYNDSIPYNFLDITSWSSILLDEKRSELIAYITSGPKVEIYSIAYPPKSAQDVLQKPRQKNYLALIYWGIPILLVTIGFIYFLLGKGHLSPVDFQEEIIKRTKVEMLKSVEHGKPSSIYLLGNFKIIDSAGSDLTSEFAPTTTQLFFLIVLATIKNGKGITSPELKNILWSDKDDKSARNNRNVHINKLRLLLKSFKELKIINDGNRQTIQGLENVFCDYVRIQTLTKLLKNSTVFNKNLLTEWADLALTGRLLPYIQHEWLEPYQTEYTNSLIELILQFKEKEEVKKDLALLLKMADVILLHDNTDEEAISLKCYALYNMGHKKQALDAFNKFESDYETLLAEKTRLSFENLIK